MDVMKPWSVKVEVEVEGIYEHLILIVNIWIVNPLILLLIFPSNFIGTIGQAFTYVSSHRRLIGHLLYLTTTRPYITFIVQQLNQFLVSPTQVHFKDACRVLVYLKQDPACGIFFPSSSSLHPQGFSDVDWVGCPNIRHSITSIGFFFRSSRILWKTKKIVLDQFIQFIQ